MKIDIDALTAEPGWHDFNGARFLIKPLLLSETNFKMQDGGIVISGQDHLKIFMDCLKDWEGVVDQNGQPLACTAKVKRKVFDFSLGGIAGFVVAEAQKFEKAKGEQEKN